MTAPDPSRLITAAGAVGADKPQLAATLASSDLSHGEIGAVGGFANALSLQSASALAQDSGAQTNFNTQEINALAGIGDQAAIAKQQQASPVDSRSWLEKATGVVAGALSNTGNFLVSNPVSQGLFHIMDKIGDAAHLPFRLISDAIDSSNNAEIDHEMQAQGYDPNSTSSYLAFMFNQGESQYHNLTNARNTYGDDMIDKIIQQQRDPEQFQADLLKMDPTAAAELKAKMNTPEWQHAFETVDNAHISPGRDLARILTLGHTQNSDGSSTGVFTFLSGALDAAYDWFSDPTLILGKGVAAARMMEVTTGALAKGARFAPSNLVAKGIDVVRGGAQRERIANILDQTGIETLLRTTKDADGNRVAVTNVGKGWEGFLARAKQLREQHAIAQDTTKTLKERQAAITQRAAIYRGMASQYGTLMPLLEEINGTRVVNEAEAAGGKVAMTSSHIVDDAAKPIESLPELADYLSSKAGLTRLTNGIAAKQEIVMPGRLSYLAETRASLWGNRSAKWIDYTKSKSLLPDASEIDALGNTDLTTAAGKAQYDALRGQKFGMIRQARARFEQKGRRLSTLLPDVKAIDLNDANSSRLVEQLGRTYMNRGDAARLASAYTLSGIADRRQIVRGLIDQSFHASGLSKSPGGKAFMEKYLGDQAGFDKQLYGQGDTSLIDVGRGETGKVQGALYPDQLSTTVVIPSFKQMNYLATKHAVGAWTGREGLGHVRAIAQSNAVDKLMGVVKMGWITSAAGGLRNALDEVVNFGATGLGKDVLAGRVAFSKATKDLRYARRVDSRERIRLVAQHGREQADKIIGERTGLAGKSYEDATRQLKQAQDAEEARANLMDNLAARRTTAAARIDENTGYHAQAKADHAVAKEQYAGGAIGQDELAASKAKVDLFAARVANSRAALRKASKDLEDPSEIQAKLEESFKDVLPVDEAQANLKAAEAELKRAVAIGQAIQYRIPLAFRGLGDTVHDVLVTPVLGKLVSTFGPKYALTEDRIKIAAELVENEVARVLKDGVFQSHMADDALTFASDDYAMDLHRAGLKARKYAYGSVPKGWAHIEPDGGAGLDAWGKQLQLRFADEKSPAHAWVQTLAALHRTPGASVGAHGSLADFAATGEDLLHGTPRKFDTFAPDPKHSNLGDRVNKGVYFTDKPHIAEQFSTASGGVDYFPEDFFDHASTLGEHYGVDAAVSRRLGDVTHQLRSGQPLYPDVKYVPGKTVEPLTHAEAEAEQKSLQAKYMQQAITRRLREGGSLRVAVEDDVERLDNPDTLMADLGAIATRHGYSSTDDLITDLDKLTLVHKGSDPRVIKAKVYGKTLDLRDPKHVPPGLRQALDAEGIYKPWLVGNGGAPLDSHDRSSALIDYMRANGYAKARVNDVWESGHESVIALPEMIAHGKTDPVAAYAKQVTQTPMSEQEWRDALLAAKQSVRGRLDDPDLRHFIDRAEVFHQVRNGEKVPLDQLKDEYADRVSGDLFATLGRRLDGTGELHINPDLLHTLASGTVPDRSWLAQIGKDERPEKTIGQLWAPYNGSHHPDDPVPSGWTQMMTHAYDKVVTDQIDALSRNPLMAALYMNARENLKPYVDHLVDHGWDEAGANEVAKRMAASHAQDEAFKHIDNPYVSSQFSMLARNWFAFVRAQEDWLRRWGRTVRDNPKIIREAQLLIHGGTSTGIVEKDPNDPTKLNFIYPGSGLALGLFGKLFAAHGVGSAAQIPMTGELSSSLTFLNPSLDNPIGFSGTPLVSLPLHALTAFLGPDHALMTASLDKAVNGDLGAGREWWEQMLPSWLNRIIGGVISKDPASKFGAAYASTLANLDAAGYLDTPEAQTATGKAHLQHAIGVQVRNNLAMNTLLGFFLPAAPSLRDGAASTGDHQGNAVDFSAHVEGLGSLKDEARQVFSQLPFDQALAWWTKVHPHELVYAQTGTNSRTKVGAEGASAPATVAAATYLEQNGAFFDKYGGSGGAAAYFIPQGLAGTTNGSYSDVAYRAQLEYGIREYKSLDDYFNDIVTSRGMSLYFTAKDAYDQAKAAAVGQAQQIKALDDQWAATKNDLFLGNPMLAERLASYAANNASNGAQIQQLTDMVKDTSPETVQALGANRAGLATLLATKAGFDDAIAALAGGRGSSANHARQQYRDNYDATVQQVAADYPGLADLIRGAFRLP